MKNPYSIGKHVYLRVPEVEDVDKGWYEWFSDPEITKYLVDRTFPNTKQKQLNFLSELTTDSSRLVLLICDINSDEIIGVTSLSNINWVHKYADLGIVIGNSNYRSGNFAIEAVSLILEIAFQRFNLQNVRGFTVEANIGSLAIQKYFGFIECGRIPNLVQYDKKYFSLVITVLHRENLRRQFS